MFHVRRTTGRSTRSCRCSRRGRRSRRSTRRRGRSSAIPYSVFVDTAGNQLPYIDQVVLTLAENLEVINLRAIAGEYDYASRHMDLGKLPVFLENQQRGNYKVYLDPGDYCDLIIKFNLNYDADAEIAKWFNTADFRRALSLGIDRDQINETFWLGTATPGSVVPVDSNKYNPGPQYRKLVVHARRQEGQRDARQDRARQEGRGGLPAARRRQGPAAHRDHDARRPVRAVHADRRDDPRAVEEDRHRPHRCRRSSAASRIKRTAANEQQLARLEQRRQRAPLHLPDPRVPLRRSTTSPPPGRSTRSGSSPPARRARSPSRG